MITESHSHHEVIRVRLEARVTLIGTKEHRKSAMKKSHLPTNPLQNVIPSVFSFYKDLLIRNGGTDLLISVDFIAKDPIQASSAALIVVSFNGVSPDNYRDRVRIHL